MYVICRKCGRSICEDYRVFLSSVAVDHEDSEYGLSSFDEAITFAGADTAKSLCEYINATSFSDYGVYKVLPARGLGFEVV